MSLSIHFSYPDGGLACGSRSGIPARPAAADVRWRTEFWRQEADSYRAVIQPADAIKSSRTWGTL
jgi:hypothetical protein